jgi:hypothetical protein
MKTAKRANNRHNRVGFNANTSAQFKGEVVCRLYNKKGNLARVSDQRESKISPLMTLIRKTYYGDTEKSKPAQDCTDPEEQRSRFLGPHGRYAVIFRQF